jgi:hypothetical protein
MIEYEIEKPLLARFGGTRSIKHAQDSIINAMNSVNKKMKKDHFLGKVLKD